MPYDPAWCVPDCGHTDTDHQRLTGHMQMVAWLDRHGIDAYRVPMLLAIAADEAEAHREDRTRTRETARAYLLVACPRCGSSPGVECQTSSGFYGGASGPHAARRKAAAGMSATEVHAAWVARRAERAESLAAEQAMFERNRQGAAA